MRVDGEQQGLVKISGSSAYVTFPHNESELHVAGLLYRLAVTVACPSLPDHSRHGTSVPLLLSCFTAVLS